MEQLSPPTSPPTFHLHGGDWVMTEFHFGVNLPFNVSSKLQMSQHKLKCLLSTAFTIHYFNGNYFF